MGGREGGSADGGLGIRPAHPALEIGTRGLGLMPTVVLDGTWARASEQDE